MAMLRPKKNKKDLHSKQLNKRIKNLKSQIKTLRYGNTK